MWCYRKLLKINFRDRITNKEVLSRMHTELHFLNDMMKRKMKYAGHVLRRSGQGIAPTDSRGASRRYKETGETKRYMDLGYAEMAGKNAYGELKKATEYRERWKLMVVTFGSMIDE